MSDYVADSPHESRKSTLVHMLDEDNQQNEIVQEQMDYDENTGNSHYVWMFRSGMLVNKK